MKKLLAIAFIALALIVGSAGVLASKADRLTGAVNAAPAASNEELQANQTGEQGQNGELGYANQAGDQGQKGESGEANQAGDQGQKGESGESPPAGAATK